MRRAERKLEVHDRWDAVERAGAREEERRVVEKIKLWERERVWYIIWRSIVMCGCDVEDVQREVVLGKRHRIGIWSSGQGAT
jgi:hypothetical protein